MFKKIYLLLDKENEQGSDKKPVVKTPAEIAAEQRKSIEVTTSKQTEQEEGEKEEEKEIEEEVEETEIEEKEEETEVEELEKVNLAKLQKTVEKLQKRLDKTTGKNRDLEKELATAKAAVEAKKAEGDLALTEEEVERRSEIKANEKTTQRAFANACDKLFKEAVKTDKDFKSKIDTIAEEISPIPSLMIGVLEDIDNGGAVLSYLASNEDDYERIYTLSPTKMALEITKISTKLLEEKKPKPKPISKVPAPIDSVNGSRQLSNEITDADTKNMAEFVRKRNLQVEEKRKNRLR